MGEKCLVTERAGHAAEFARSLCSEEPYTHICVHGGDGTLNETLRGILEADAGKTAFLTCIPNGSGNDFATFINNFMPEKKCFPIDVLRHGDSVAVNIVNGGFDCGAVARSEKLRAGGMNGKLSYLVGVAEELIRKRSFNGRIVLRGVHDTVTGETLHDEEIEGEFLLCALANCRLYGGGFCAAPEGDPTDGLIDVMLVRNVGRMKFVSLVGDYKKGQHISHGRLIDRFADVGYFRRCTDVRAEGFPAFCFDGEVTPTDALELHCIHAAVRYMKPEQKYIIR
jgi:diacylglycerol kinase family enzyme